MNYNYLILLRLARKIQLISWRRAWKRKTKRWPNVFNEIFNKYYLNTTLIFISILLVVEFCPKHNGFLLTTKQNRFRKKHRQHFASQCDPVHSTRFAVSRWARTRAGQINSFTITVRFSPPFTLNPPDIKQLFGARCACRPSRRNGSRIVCDISLSLAVPLCLPTL